MRKTDWLEYDEVERVAQKANLPANKILDQDSKGACHGAYICNIRSKLQAFGYDNIAIAYVLEA